MQAMNWALAAVLCLVALLVGAAIAGFLAYRKGVQSGVEQRKQQAEATIGSAEKEAGRILEDAKKEAEAKRKNAMVEAKDEILQRPGSDELPCGGQKRQPGTLRTAMPEML